MSKKQRLGHILVEGGLINETQLSAALHSQKTWGGKLGSTLVRMGFVKEEDLLSVLSAQLRVPSVDFGKVEVSPRGVQQIPKRIAEKYGVVPVALKEEMGKKAVILAMSDPTDLETIADIEFQTGVSVRPVVAMESSIAKAIDDCYGKPRAKSPYGYEKKVDLSQFSEWDDMVVLSKGEERVVSRLDRMEALELVWVLIRALEKRGVIDRKDLEAALTTSSGS